MKKLHPFLKPLFTLMVHVLLWVAVYFFYTYFLGYGSTNTDYISRFSLFLMPVTIGVSYFFLYFLVPNYLLQKKQKLFVLYSVYTFIVSFFFVILSIFYGLTLSDYLNGEGITPITKSAIFIVFGVYFVVFIVISFGLIIHNYSVILNNEDLKNKFLKAQLQLKEQELKFLKMQIHPHFLFNSLNTIYGFALNKADEAPEMILKLSNLLDYILYQIEKPSVVLEDEVNHLEDYISLERMRFHDTLEVYFNKENCNQDVQIAPMLLIPFVENSFKHGTIIDGKLKVNIQLSTVGKELIFEVENSSRKSDSNSPGIGLENIKKRLEMLYPASHSLGVIQEGSLFKVTLKVNIDGLKLAKNE
jgi:sensor histidine kinase YesM